MAQWEYKVESHPVNLEGTETVYSILDDNGVNGWELVNIIPEYTNTTNVEDQVDSIYVSKYAFVFKRQI